ncbi:esterase [Klebsiella pneumoniae]|uniref:Carboxylic ester hydrolase n=1 Tax=Klebsiella pneumoniae TaxID=573 RepID=A0A377ZZQ2_KLEPN|nr:esterase [Klebsiella pneumoniae]
MVAQPIIYEDFLPVSAAGIFQSNLGNETQARSHGNASREAFEAALGCPVQDDLNYTDRRRTQQTTLRSAVNQYPAGISLTGSRLCNIRRNRWRKPVRERLAGSAEQGIHIWRGHSVRRAARGPAALARAAASRPLAGVRPAETFSAASWQDIDYCRELGGGDPGAFSEDCLYLNVWAPASAAQPQPLPVMVAAWRRVYHRRRQPAALRWQSAASRDVVVVTVNYRLGHLGFFAHPALEEEAGERLYNFALLDQIAALQWVQENIHAFGGDAANVTLFGESAGARSVLSLMASPKAKGLFHKAIIQSGYTLPDLPREKALEKGRCWRNTSPYRQASAEELRAIPAEAFWSLTAPLNTGPAPIAGDAVLPQPMLETFFAGRQIRYR